METRVVYSCVFYLLAFVLVIVSKPPAVFDTRGHLRPFSCVEANGTLSPLGVVTAVMAASSYYLFCVLDVVFHT